MVAMMSKMGGLVKMLSLYKSSSKNKPSAEAMGKTPIMEGELPSLYLLQIHVCGRKLEYSFGCHLRYQRYSCSGNVSPSQVQTGLTLPAAIFLAAAPGGSPYQTQFRAKFVKEWGVVDRGCSVHVSILR